MRSLPMGPADNSGPSRCSSFPHNGLESEAVSRMPCIVVHHINAYVVHIQRMRKRCHFHGRDKMKTITRTYLLSIALLFLSTYSSAQLTVQTATYGSKPGYIDQATLVVQPHGGYVEQSLLLSYSDHNQYTGYSQVEIVHRFQLPANAVVNDLWLWIGDTARQGKILSTWAARKIYDSIVSKHRDPAFLTKNGNIYELHVYPLVPGSFRKIMLNFITPSLWLGKNGTAELPLKMLKDNNAQKKPLQLLFRVVEPTWGNPLIAEMPGQLFGPSTDSIGYKYRATSITDISSLSSFTLGYVTNFVGGSFFTSSDVQNDATYFQFGIDPGSFFGLQIDSTAKRLLFALDLSGGHSKNFATLIPNVKQLMSAVAKPNDSIYAVVAGAGKLQPLIPAWRIGSADSVNAMIDQFASSDWGAQISQQRLPNILYADFHAQICWQFPGLGDLATYVNYSTLLDALQNFRNAEVIAAYDHGFEAAVSTKANLTTILAKIDSFFAQGGRFLSYYDFNRVGNEVIGSHYIPGLTTVRRADGSETLYRNTTGNIGIYFPESFVHFGFDYLQYSPDPTVKIEVQNAAGSPVVISKKIGNGLLIISAIWSFTDDGALRSTIGVPLLGLNKAIGNQMLTGLLDNIKATYTKSVFDRVIVLSNSDSLFQKGDAQNWTDSYLIGFGGAVPKFTTINLLDGQGYVPAYITDQQIQYYGSGYLLKTIASASKGSHFETHLDQWNHICSSLTGYSYPVADSLFVAASVDSGLGQLKDIREVDPAPADANKARFFIGSTSLANIITFNARATFSGISGEKKTSGTFFLNHDTTKMDNVVPAMLGNEHLTDLFNQPVRDTAAIVKQAVQYRLLCDYTAFLVLDPNDTVQSTKNPTGGTGVDDPLSNNMMVPDSILLSAYPSPFNNQTNIVVTIGRASLVTVSVYNILGQLVRVLAINELVQGTKVYSWNGADSHNTIVSSGIYFIHLVAKEKFDGSVKTKLRKIVFLK